VDYLQFCFDWWAKGGLVNFIILGSSFFVGLFYLSNKFSKGFVNIMIGVVPLLGLLGTVVGMIQTFNALQNTGTDVQSLAGGISKAMITTSSGLCVAIFGTIFLPLKKPEKLDDYESVDNLTVEQLDRDGTTIKSYIFRNAYPLTLADIELSYETVNALEEFEVTWRYQHFEASGVNF